MISELSLAEVCGRDGSRSGQLASVLSALDNYPRDFALFFFFLCYIHWIIDRKKYFKYQSVSWKGMCQEITIASDPWRCVLVKNCPSIINCSDAENCRF